MRVFVNTLIHFVSQMYTLVIIEFDPFKEKFNSFIQNLFLTMANLYLSLIKQKCKS